MVIERGCGDPMTKGVELLWSCLIDEIEQANNDVSRVPNGREKGVTKLINHPWKISSIHGVAASCSMSKQ